MGVSRTPEEFVTKLKAAQQVMGDAGTRKSLLPVADVVRDSMLAAAAVAGLHPGSKIAGRPWRGVYIRNQGTADLVVGYARPAHLVNNATRPHIIGAKGLGTKRQITKRTTAAAVASLFGQSSAATFRPGASRRGKGKVLHWGNQFAAYVRVPGTRGKRFFERSIPVAQREGGKVLDNTIERGLSRVFQ